MKNSAAPLIIILVIAAIGAGAYFTGMVGLPQRTAATPAATSVEASPAVVDEKCAIAVKLTPGTVTSVFTAVPARTDAAYNWTTDAGVITDGQGTSEITVDTTGVRTEVTASVELLKPDPACPAGSNKASATLAAPK